MFSTRPDSLVPLHSLLKPKRNPTTLQGRVFRGRRNGDQRRFWRQKALHHYKLAWLVVEVPNAPLSFY
ncbi:hypothetical protein AAC387_Pa10g1983 [Persea americana]